MLREHQWVHPFRELLAEKGSSLAPDSQCSWACNELQRTGVSPGAATAGSLLGTAKGGCESKECGWGREQNRISEKYTTRTGVPASLPLETMLNLHIFTQIS